MLMKMTKYWAESREGGKELKLIVMQMMTITMRKMLMNMTKYWAESREEADWPFRKPWWLSWLWWWCCCWGWTWQNIELRAGRRQTGHLGSLGRPQSGSHPSSSSLRHRSIAVAFQPNPRLLLFFNAPQCYFFFQRAPRLLLLFNPSQGYFCFVLNPRHGVPP